MRIALASPSIPSSLKDGLASLEKLVESASTSSAEIVCFPESFLPGYPGMAYSEADRTPAALKIALSTVCDIAKRNSIAIIIPMDWHSNLGIQNVAFVVSSQGEILGYQTKNQLDPSEDDMWLPGEKRRIFEVNNVKFGICICHEGFRYPETVRWAAQNDAKIVFHPHFAIDDTKSNKLQSWGEKDNPYYEKAAMMRALENTIFFASVNYASDFSESASAIIAPDGSCLASQQYNHDGVLVADIALQKATGLLAKRYKNHLF